MGGKATKEVPKELPPGQRLIENMTEESFNRLMMEAYVRGQEEAVAQCLAQAASQRQEDLITGGGAAVVLLLGMSAFYGGRAARQADEHERAQAEVKQLALVKDQDLALERQRVQELLAVSDAQKNMLRYHEDLLETTRKRQSALAARYRQAKLQNAGLRKQLQSLRLDVRELLKTNGQLNQRFMGATAGAIGMSLVCAYLAFASHHGGGGGHGDAHPAQPASPPLVAPVVEVAPAVPATPAPALASEVAAASS